MNVSLSPFYAIRNERNGSFLVKADRVVSDGIINNLYEGGTVNITLTGGDIFARSDWREVLAATRRLGYHPYISTKTPLTEDDIRFLQSIGYNEVQFSLDSSDVEVLSRLVKAPEGYLDKVKDFFEACDKSGFKLLIRSVLTKLNSSPTQLRELYDFLARFECVKEWAMTPAFISQYKRSDYEELAPDNNNLKFAYSLSEKEDLKFKIILNKITDEGYTLKKCKNESEFVKQNQICLANVTTLSILANGECSVCEMLYDNPDFLLGNIRESTIAEVWNSDKALRLYTLRQSEAPATTPCARCKEFVECRNKYGKRVCYVDIVKSGKGKWDPDPRCPHAELTEIIY